LWPGTLPRQAAVVGGPAAIEIRTGRQRALPRLSWLWIAVALVLGALLPGHAAAQGGRGTGAQMLDVIREQMQKGEALFVAGKYQEAAAAFEDGYRQHPYSAFLFNAGVAYQRLGDTPKALERFRSYVAADPAAPDVGKVKDRIRKLEAELAAVPKPPAADAGAEPTADAGPTDAGVASPPSAPVDEPSVMKSLAVIETVPAGAPIRLYAAADDTAAPFRFGQGNPGWAEVAAARTPANLSLDVGRYHLVVETYRDFNVSEIEFRVRPSYVHHLLANLSQGKFMAFLRVAANVEGASVHLDDKQKRRAAWGRTPHGELVSGGKHTLLVEAPGYQPYFKELQLSHGEEKEIEVELARVEYGYLRIDANAPEIKVAIDGKPVGVWRSGQRPLEVKLEAGEHQLVIRATGYKTHESMVKTPRGQVLPLHAKMIQNYPRGAAWTQAIIGAVFLGTAIYLGVESNNLHEELEADKRAGVLEADDERIVRGRWFSIGADVGFAIGGVLAILATYNFIKDPYPDSSVARGRLREFDDPRKPRQKRASPEASHTGGRRPAQRGIELGFGPLVSPNGGGFGIGGTF
jgi:tetratricopeptide (TPR) repeat protein